MDQPEANSTPAQPSMPEATPQAQATQLDAAQAQVQDSQPPVYTMDHALAEAFPQNQAAGQIDPDMQGAATDPHENMFTNTMQSISGLADKIGDHHYAPVVASVLSEVGTTPAQKLQIFKATTGKGYESRLNSEGAVEYRRDEDKPGEWKTVQPGVKFDSSQSQDDRTNAIGRRLLNATPDMVEGIGGAAIGGALGVTGGVGGAIAGAMTGPAGAALAGVGGAAAGMAAGGFAAHYIRDASAVMLGADSNPQIAASAAMMGGLNAVLSGAGQFIRSGMAVAKERVKANVAGGLATRAVKLGELLSTVQDYASNLIGKPIEETKAALQRVPSPEAAVQGIGNVSKQISDQMGATIKHVENTLLPPNADKKYIPQEYIRRVENELLGPTGQYQIKDVTDLAGNNEKKLILREGANTDIDPDAALKRTMVSDWESAANGGGIRLGELMNRTDQLAKRGFDGDVALARNLRQGLRMDRDGIFTNLAKNTEVDGIAVSAYKDASAKKDALDEINSVFASSPKDLLNHINKNSTNAQSVKNIMHDPLAAEMGGADKWADFQHAWYQDHLDNVTPENGSNYPDFTKLYKNMNRDPEVANVMVGREAMNNFHNFSQALAGIGGWKEVFKDPTSELAGRYTKMFSNLMGAISGSHFHQAALIGDVFKYDPNILQIIRDRGIAAALPDMRSAAARGEKQTLFKGVNALMNFGQIGVPGIEGPVTLERWAVPTLLKGVMRPWNEPPAQQQQAATSAWNDYTQQQQMRSEMLDAQYKFQMQQPQRTPVMPQMHYPNSAAKQKGPDFTHMSDLFARPGGRRH